MPVTASKNQTEPGSLVGCSPTEESLGSPSLHRSKPPQKFSHPIGGRSVTFSFAPKFGLNLLTSTNLSLASRIPGIAKALAGPDYW